MDVKKKYEEYIDPDILHAFHFPPETIQEQYEDPETIQEQYEDPETIQEQYEDPETIQEQYEYPKTIQEQYEYPKTIQEQYEEWNHEEWNQDYELLKDKDNNLNDIYPIHPFDEDEDPPFTDEQLEHLRQATSTIDSATH